MRILRLIIFVAVLAVFDTSCWADVQRIAVLRDSLQVAVLGRDSLQVQQQRVQQAVDSLAAKIAQLKQGHIGGRASGALETALRQSVQLTLAMEALYVEGRTIADRIDHLHKQLIQAYDVEIDRIIATLTTDPAPSVVAQLQDLQQQRQQLIAESEETLVSIPSVVVRADDTPEDIRLKFELMADVAQQVQREMASADVQLKRLLEEQRLRSRLQNFTREFSLFDETSAEGRSVSAQVADRQEEPAEAPDFGASEIAGIAGPDAGGTETRVPENGGLAPTAEVQVGREVQLGGNGPVAAGGADGLAGEILLLQQRRQTLKVQKQQVEDRKARLELYLKQLLEGTP